MKVARLACAVLLLTTARYLIAQLSDSDTSTQAACRNYLAIPLPAEAKSIPAPQHWPACNSYKLYSDIGTKVDYAAARRCAWSERLAVQAGLEPRSGVASVFGGSAMLSVLYANGYGVPRNYPLSIRFACEAEGAPAEIALRLQHLKSMQASENARATAFDFCDDIASGFMQGFCAARDSEIKEGHRKAQLQSLASRFTPGQRSAFTTLSKLEQEYARAHALGEIDLSGTARAMYQIDAEDTLRDDFVAALQAFESGKHPSGTAESSRLADARLNATYHNAMSDAEVHKNEYGAVQPGGIRDAERAWLKYRDAWIAFAKLRYPDVSADAWLALLTSDRTSILDGSFCDMDAVDGPCTQNGQWKPVPLP